jgi:hypothetical protein
MMDRHITSTIITKSTLSRKSKSTSEFKNTDFWIHVVYGD